MRDVNANGRLDAGDTALTAPWWSRRWRSLGADAKGSVSLSTRFEVASIASN